MSSAAKFNFTKNQTYKMILFLLRPYRFLVLMVFFSLVVFAVMEGINIALIYTVLNQTLERMVSIQSPSKIPLIISFISDHVAIKNIFVLSCVLLIISFLVKALFSFLSQFLGCYFSYKIKRDFHNAIFNRFLNSEYTFFFNHKHGWLIHRTITVPLEASTFFDYIPRIAVNALRILVIIAMLFFISPKVTVFIIVLTAFYYFVTRAIGKKVSYSLGAEKVLELEQQNEIAAEAFTGIKQIKVFMSIGAWVERFRASVVRYSRITIKEAVWLLLPPAIIEFLVMSSLIALLMVSKYYYANSFISSLPIIAIVGYAIQRIIPCFNLLGVQVVSFFGLLPVVEIAYGIMADFPKPHDGMVEIKKFSDKISFKSVSFSYPGRDPLFNDLSFDIKKGTSVAIVGFSGSGKSTIVDLILRLLTASKGSIFIDDIDLNNVRISSWLGKIGLVTQDSFVFHGTIKDNIALGTKDADMEEVISAATEANAHDFISQFPQGYDTVIGDRGIKISGGQRQRIAIARAIFRKPEILILDEATNSLDNISEIAVQRAIDNSARGRTVIIIAHKISTIMHADKILVIKDGKILEEGSHQALMDIKGLYHEMYNTNKIMI